MSPYADVPINVPFAGDSSGIEWLFQILDPASYSIVPGKFRATVDSLSQTDGSSIQPPYIDGLVATLELAYYQLPGADGDSKGGPACKEVLRLMDQLLMGALNSLRTYPTDVSTQQYLWTPTGATQRLLDGVILASWPAPDFTKGPPEVRRKFQLGSPYPYALTNAPHTSPMIAPGTTVTITNAGNIEGLPILFMNGPSSFFQVTNLATGLSLTYDSTLPGALAVPTGHTLQIDFHQGSVLLDGNPDLDYIAGLAPGTSDFWPLIPGAQAILNSVSSVGFPYFVSYDYHI